MHVSPLIHDASSTATSLQFAGRIQKSDFGANQETIYANLEARYAPHTYVTQHDTTLALVSPKGAADGGVGIGILG